MFKDFQRRLQRDIKKRVDARTSASESRSGGDHKVSLFSSTLAALSFDGSGRRIADLEYVTVNEFTWFVLSHKSLVVFHLLVLILFRAALPPSLSSIVLV